MIIKLNRLTSILILISFSYIGFSCSSSSDVSQYDVLIKNTNIVDGTGKGAFVGDVAIKARK